MFRYMLGGGDMQSYLIGMLLSLPIVFLSLSLHETAHGYIAYRLGDPTAKSLGRLTLNPVKHLDPIGFLCMLLAGFGWANPVPVNSRYFKKPRRYSNFSSNYAVVCQSSPFCHGKCCPLRTHWSDGT